MLYDSSSPPLSQQQSPPTCYFSIVPTPSDHFSSETPSTTPLSSYSAEIFSEPTNPLLAFRPPPFDLHMSSSSSSMDGSKLLQLQTSAAHRPDPQPLQHGPESVASDSSSNSSCSGSPGHGAMPELVCVRCRRTSTGSMINVGTSLYYCRHCAQMVGYGTG